MTAAHRLPGVLMRRCRGARAVATFSGGVESRNAPARIAPATPCSSLGVERPDAQPEPPRAQSRSSARPAEPFNGRNAQVDAPATAVPVLCSRHTREIDARPSTISNAASNERSSEPGRCLVSSEAPGCRGDAYTQPSPCEMTTHCMAKANAGDGGRHGCTKLRPAAPRAFRCRPLPLAAAFFFATPVDQVTDIPRPYAHMQADELADEITVARECIATTRDLRLRKQMQAKLAELINERNLRPDMQQLPY